MKKPTLVYTLFAFLLFFASCNQYEAAVLPTKGNATFIFSEKTPIQGGRTNASPASILLSISDGNGNEILKDKKLQLLTFGQTYTTESLSLTTGTYMLTKFLVMNASNEIIYATPMEGADLASYVNDPLPISFSIAENATSQIAPQVLAVAEEDHPESFGYASFGFIPISITVISIPTCKETITRVTYEFTNGSKTIKSERSLSGSILDLNNQELVGKTWQARILAWPETVDCYQKVYRYKGELTFNGGFLKLPDFDKKGWVAFYYIEKEGVQIFRTDPRESYRIEIQSPEGQNVYGYVDRGFYNEAGDALCDNQMFTEISGRNRVEVHIEDQLDCETQSAGLIDSFLTLNIIGPVSRTVQDYFLWEVKDGVIKPSCPSEGGRSANHRNNLRHHE
jgi:hypothetical protein